MPSAFTPNADMRNDCFGVKNWGLVLNLDFSVYNRWGERIFYTQNPSACWDGNYKGIKQPPGTYVYQIRAKTLCGDVYRKGTVVLIR
ncbi:gliding motility-associated C-terminal domain-containing protein [Foetidibacter luteolus]|uniref:T9SS type B sorting domain-containing protein n=1 Tax=Foetidibacter luteolus TaxID=2608880 RepID=UPI00129B3972|nr:gliding motility-associated C-terminal domain-containing protein [Foetidibacter luteolus]